MLTRNKYSACCNYQIFVTRQEIGEKKGIREIGLHWDVNPDGLQMYY